MSTLNYAKYLLDQLFICLGLFCKRVSTMGVNTRGQSTLGCPTLHLFLVGWDIMGIGYMALWGFGAKCLTGWMDEVDTP